MNKDLAPSGKLKIGLNYSNFLLVIGDDANGEPKGIAPDLGRELARKTGMPFEFVKFDAAGKLFDAVKSAQCDVGFLGAEPQRADEVDFTNAYLEIPVTFLVPAGSPIKTIADVDREGVRIAVSERSAYDLYLSRTLKKAQLIRTKGIPASYDAFMAQKLEVLGGLKPKLVEEQARTPGSRVLDGQITGVQQAIGAPKGRPAAAKYLREFAEEVKRSGFVARAIEEHGVKGVRVAP
ncbi:MAG TPA: transporter substrate-binding domain-containing protein [Burkholderiales bacterium]|jgi:polar amino acid transport system substrate-binding protein|nr:transporter substrate-binding domain-containing protein [Burkholderiales bacterium]